MSAKKSDKAQAAEEQAKTASSGEAEAVKSGNAQASENQAASPGETTETKPPADSGNGQAPSAGNPPAEKKGKTSLYEVRHPIRHNGKRYRPGETLELTAAEAKNLLMAEAVRKAEKSS